SKTKLFLTSCSKKCLLSNHHHPSPPPLHYRGQVPSPVGQFRRQSWLRVKYSSRVLLLSCYRSY
ncbi:unnamed protein product, partial [Brassica rapa]